MGDNPDSLPKTDEEQILEMLHNSTEPGNPRRTGYTVSEEADYGANKEVPTHILESIKKSDGGSLKAQWEKRDHVKKYL